MTIIVGSSLLLSLPVGHTFPCPASLLPAPMIPNLLLQRNSAATCVWGFSEAGDIVTTNFRGENMTAVTDSSGVWRQFLPPQPATMRWATTVPLSILVTLTLMPTTHSAHAIILARPQSLLFHASSGESARLDDVLFGVRHHHHLHTALT